MESIEEYAFEKSKITQLIIPSNVTNIVYNNLIDFIKIDRTYSCFLNDVTVGFNWYSETPTIQ